MIREEIEKAITEALPGVDFVVERPRDMAHGDYSTNAALVAKVDPNELAAKLKVNGIERVEAVGRFINFFLTREALVPQEQKIPQFNAGKNFLVEYTSPNLFKPLHIGNLISNILGESIARLLEGSGAKVVRINYPSDIGLTVAKGVWGLQKLGLNPADIADLGRAYVAGNDAYETDEAAKKEIESINKALYEDSDPALGELRRLGIETSRKHLDEICERLGSKFDREFFESEAGPVGTALVKANIGTVFEESDGAVVYRGEQEGLHTRVFLNSQGLPTYEAKDLGLLKLKLEAYPDFDVTLTDTGQEQKEYFKVLYVAARKVFPELAHKTLGHIAHGYLKLTTGKMSSRKGNVITGESLLADLTAEAKNKMQGRQLADADKTAEQIAVGAVKYAVLKQGSGKDIIFDPEKSLSLEGDSGPYLQYSLVRARSVLKKVRPESVVADVEKKGYWMTLARVLVHYPEVVARAAQEMEPHYLTTYLTELAAAFNHWYGVDQFIVDDKILGIYLKLIQVFEHTMVSGLTTLGIPTPEEM